MSTQAMRNSYMSYAIEKLPKNSQLVQAVEEYLKMRLHKNSHLSQSEWNGCIDELLSMVEIPDSNARNTRVRKLTGKEPVTVEELIYLFNTATARRYNHIYFTQQQDRMYANMSYYQDPYWHDLKQNDDTRKILEEELGNGTAGCDADTDSKS